MTVGSRTSSTHVEFSHGELVDVQHKPLQSWVAKNGRTILRWPTYGHKSKETYQEHVICLHRTVATLLSMAPPRVEKRVERILRLAKAGHRSRIQGPIIVQDGKVIDGQHRLEAIFRSGIQMSILIEYRKGTK